MVEMDLHLPKLASRLVVRAEYTDESGAVAVGELNAVAAYSPAAKFLKVVLKTADAISVGQFVVLHLYANFAINHFYFVVNGHINYDKLFLLLTRQGLLLICQSGFRSQMYAHLHDFKLIVLLMLI